MFHEKAKGEHPRLTRLRSEVRDTGGLGPFGIDVSYVYTHERPTHREFVSHGPPSEHEEVA